MLGYPKPDPGPIWTMAKFLLISIEMALSIHCYFAQPLYLNIREVLLDFSLQNLEIKILDMWVLFLVW